MDDNLACSDLCEEKGFDRQAAMLRKLAGSGGKVFVVAERGYDYNDEIFFFPDGDGGPPSAGQPQIVFLDRESAERAALERNTRKFREIHPLAFCYNVREITELSKRDLNQRLRGIFGKGFELGSEDDFDPDESPFPADATDEQMQQAAGLFTLRFFHVLEVEFGG